MDEYIIVVDGKVVWKGRNEEDAWKARDAISAVSDRTVAVYRLADESARSRW